MSGVWTSRYLVVDMPHGSVLRIEPVKSRRDDSTFECVAENGIGEPAVASATLTVYEEGSGELYFGLTLSLR